MTQKIKLLLGLAGFALLMGVALIAYNILGKQVKLDDSTLAQQQGDASNADRQKAPDFTMHDGNGNTVTLSGIIANSKPVVLNFWASWCPPCKSEMPIFDKVYTELGGEIQFMMVDLADGRRETIQKGIQYVNDQQFSFPVFFDTGQEGAYLYGIRAIPTTVFIDKDGYLITGAQGAIDERTLRRGIEMIRD